MIKKYTMRRKLFAPAILFLIVIGGCRTYYIPVDSFREQFSGIDVSSLEAVSTRGPVGNLAPYRANRIIMIECVDKYGNRVKLPNGPSIEARITTKEGKRTIFYFDRMYVQNDTLVGYRSRFMGLPKKIPLSAIAKIEVQDGHKNFHYN